MLILQRPFFFFFLAALFLAAISFSFPGKTIDVHWHDTYYVIAFSHILLAFSLWLFLCWGIYMASKKILRWVSLVHYHFLLTLLPIVLLLFYSTRDAGITRIHLGGLYQTNALVSFCLLAFLAGQLLMVVNLVAGVFSKKPSRQ